MHDNGAVPTDLSFAQHLTGFHAHVELARYAGRSGLDVPVPACPGWTVRRLVGHQGAVHRWAAAAFRGEDLEWAPIEKAGRSSSDPVEWLRDGAIALVKTLVDAPEDAEAPVFLQDAPPPRRFWARRQCHETTIHAVDGMGRRSVGGARRGDVGDPPRSRSTASTSCCSGSSRAPVAAALPRAGAGRRTPHGRGAVVVGPGHRGRAGDTRHEDRDAPGDLVVEGTPSSSTWRCGTAATPRDRRHRPLLARLTVGHRTQQLAPKLSPSPSFPARETVRAAPGVAGSAPCDVPALTDGTVTLRARSTAATRRRARAGSDPVSVRWTNVPGRPHSPTRSSSSSAPRAWAAARSGSSRRRAEPTAPVRRQHRAARRGPRARRDRVRLPPGRARHRRDGGRVRLLLEWGFARQGVQTVIWRANVGNWASRKLAWRLGFTLDGVLRHSHVFRGGLVDAWVGTLLADEPREPRGAWLDVPALDGDGVRLRPFASATCRGSSRRAPTSAPSTGSASCPSPYTEADARSWVGSQHRAAGDRPGVTWAMADPATDVLLGSITSSTSTRHRRARSATGPTPTLAAAA